MIATGERRWSVALALALGAPVAALALCLLGMRLQVGPRDAWLFVMAVAVALTVLGLHLVPLPWWARGVIAAVWLPLVAGAWVSGMLVFACLLLRACL